MPNKGTWCLLGVEVCGAASEGHGEERLEGPAEEPLEEGSDLREGFNTSCVESAVEKIKMINKHNGMVVYLIAYQYANINKNFILQYPTYALPG